MLSQREVVLALAVVVVLDALVVLVVLVLGLETLAFHQRGLLSRVTVTVAKGTLGLGSSVEGVGAWAGDSRPRLSVRLRNRLRFGAQVRLVTAGEVGRRRAVVGVGGVANGASRRAVLVTVTVMVRMVRMAAVDAVGLGRRLSAVRVDIWCQARTGGPGRLTGWPGVPVDPSVVANVVRLQVVTGPIEKWVWVR